MSQVRTLVSTLRRSGLLRLTPHLPPSAPRSQIQHLVLKQAPRDFTRAVYWTKVQYTGGFLFCYWMASSNHGWGCRWSVIWW